MILIHLYQAHHLYLGHLVHNVIHSVGNLPSQCRLNSEELIDSKSKIVNQSKDVEKKSQEKGFLKKQSG